eukprot:2475141-Rhodomonas_salina.1
MVSLGQQYSIGDQGEEKKNFYLSGMSKCPRCGNGTRSSSCSAGCRMNGDAYGTDVCTTNLFWPSVEPWHSYSLVFEFMLTVKTAGIPLFLWMEHVVPVGRGVRHRAPLVAAAITTRRQAGRKSSSGCERVRAPRRRRDTTPLTTFTSRPDLSQRFDVSGAEQNHLALEIKGDELAWTPRASRLKMQWLLICVSFCVGFGLLCAWLNPTREL